MFRPTLGAIEGRIPHERDLSTHMYSTESLRNGSAISLASLQGYHTGMEAVQCPPVTEDVASALICCPLPRLQKI